LRELGVLIMLLCLAAPGFPPEQKKSTGTVAHRKPSSAKKKPSPAKKPVTSAAKKRAPTKKGAATSKKSRSKKRGPSWRAGQQAPTRERYQEVQQVLVDKGYLQGPANGVWGPESVEALKKFQADQNLEPSGKLDSLSLITLGLGPRRELSGASGGNGSVVLRTNQAAPAKTDPNRP